jgi:hypothetical protein
MNHFGEWFFEHFGHQEKLIFLDGLGHPGLWFIMVDRFGGRPKVVFGKKFDNFVAKKNLVPLFLYISIASGTFGSWIFCSKKCLAFSLWSLKWKWRFSHFLQPTENENKKLSYVNDFEIPNAQIRIDFRACGYTSLFGVKNDHFL